MEKILNIPKYNTYGSNLVVNKYIYMKRDFLKYKIYYIYHISEITNEKFPIIYNCNRGFELITYKDKKPSTVNDFKNIKLENNDLLYEISIDEFLAIFKVFVECDNSKLRVTDDLFEK